MPSAAVFGRGGGAAQVLVDSADEVIGPAKLPCELILLSLHVGTTPVVPDLGSRRLSQIDDRQL